MRYILVEWPESQKFMENEDCIPGCDGEIWFVPEDIYYKTNGFIHPFSKTVKKWRITRHFITISKRCNSRCGIL